MAMRHPDHNLSDPRFRTQHEWESWDTATRVAHLRPVDQPLVAPLFHQARCTARAQVQAEWLAAHGSLTARAIFAGWRAASDVAALNAESELWAALHKGEIPSRCRHGASSNACLIVGCRHLWKVPPRIEPTGYPYGGGRGGGGDWRVDTKP